MQIIKNYVKIIKDFKNNFLIMTDFYEKEICRMENNTRSLEQLKKRINVPYLVDFLKERINSRKENEKKQELLKNFLTLSKEEQRIYRDYIAGLMQNDPNLIKDFDDDLEQLIWLLKSMDRLEIYATFQNAYREDNDILKEKAYIEIAWWSIEKKVIKPFDWFKFKKETYQIVWWNTEYLWNNIYKINLEWIKNEWSLRYKTEESIIIKYDWWNTFQVIDPNTNTNLWIQNLNIQKYKRWQIFKNTVLNVKINNSKIKVWLNIFDQN